MVTDEVLDRIEQELQGIDAHYADRVRTPVLAETMRAHVTGFLRHCKVMYRIETKIPDVYVHLDMSNKAYFMFLDRESGERITLKQWIRRG